MGERVRRPTLPRSDGPHWRHRPQPLDGTSRLVILSGRTPGYDLTTNRVNKRARDQILRELGSHVAAAIADRLPPTIAPSSGADTATRALVRT